MKWNLFGKEQTYSFIGAYNHHIELVMYPKVVVPAEHVVVLPVYKERIVFTKHKTRGLEWPGGKLERGEKPIQAALRELKEEIGATTHSLWLVGQYRVLGLEGTFFKNVYAAEIEQLGEATGDDTEGAELLPLHISPTKEDGFSPLVCDEVYQRVKNSVLVLN